MNVFGKINRASIHGVDYGVFGKFRFMTQAAYDVLSSYEDAIYFVRSS